jgi:hypothetical protein
VVCVFASVRARVCMCLSYCVIAHLISTSIIIIFIIINMSPLRTETGGNSFSLFILLV